MYMIKLIDRVGQEGEELYLEVLGDKYLVHAVNNINSPFVFSSIVEAQAFLKLIIKVVKNV